MRLNNKDLLRGVDLHQTLRQRGWILRQKPSGLGNKNGALVYACSYKTETLDMFISHAWQTQSWQKILSLLIHSGWRFTLAFRAASVSLSILLCLLDILPSFYSTWGVVLEFEATIPLGIWAELTGLISAPYFCPQEWHDMLPGYCMYQSDR